MAAILSASAVRLVDTATNKKLDDIADEGVSKASLRQMTVSPDGKYAVAYGPGGVLFINAADGKVVGRVLPFKSVADLEHVW